MEESVEGEEAKSVEEIFARTAEELLGATQTAVEEPAVPEPKDGDDAEVEGKGAKKGKKKKKGRELEYDPEHDVTIVRRHREDWEGGGEDW